MLAEHYLWHIIWQLEIDIAGHPYCFDSNCLYSTSCQSSWSISLLALSIGFCNVWMFSCYQGTEFVINLAAISHIKILISFRPQIIRTLIFILASIGVNMWLAAVIACNPFSFLSFCPSETLWIHSMFLLCSNFKQSIWLDLQTPPSLQKTCRWST